MNKYKLETFPEGGNTIYTLYVRTKRWHIFPYWKRIWQDYNEERCMEVARVYSSKPKEFVL